LDFLQYHNLKISDIKDISSFEAKKDEKGLLKFALKYNFDIKFYEKEDINKLEQNFSKSASTKFFGLKGVAEPSAVLSSYYNELIITKNIFYNEITIAGAI
jgi:cobalt-precorrin 5A hydrolase